MNSTINNNNSKSLTMFPHNKYSFIVYNHYNQTVMKKLEKELAEIDISLHQVTLEDEEFFVLTYGVEVSKNDFLKHLKMVVNKVMQKLKIHLISVEFEDVVGIVTHMDSNRIKPLGLRMKNVPLLNTAIKGEYTAHPKTLEECYEVLTVAHDNESFDLVSAEFAFPSDKNTTIVLIEKADRIPVLLSRITNQVVL